MYSTPEIDAIHTRIQTLKAEQLGLYLPSLASLEQQIQHNAARAVVNDAFKATVQHLIDTKADGEAAWRRNGEINTEITRLADEITSLQQQERHARVQDAERAYLALKNEFGISAKALCRLYVQLKELDARNARNVPGWQSRTPPRFNVQALNPPGWQGETCDMLPLPWMVKESERAA